VKKFIPLILFLCAAFTLYASGSKEKPAGSGTSRTVSGTGPAAGRNSYFTGSGGRELSLAVLVPEGKSLAADQAYLPTLVQGVFVSDLAKYSGIRVLDRQNLEKVLSETESGIYKNEEDYLKLGEIANVNHAMTGTITKTSTGYALQIQIVPTSGASAATRASYSATCTVAELDNFTAIKKASAELLAQLRVDLTDLARQELAAAATVQVVDAQTSLARGITAQRGGTEVAALAYYMASAQYDPKLIEAASRLNVLSADITSGGVRENALNDIEWRKQWLARLKECEDFIAATIQNNPQCAYTISCGPLNLSGLPIDYMTETMSPELRVNLSYQLLPQFNVLSNVINQVRQGLNATGRAEAWGLSGWPGDDQIYAVSARGMFVEIEVLNENGKRLASGTAAFPVYWCIYREKGTVQGAVLGNLYNGLNALTYLRYKGPYDWCDYTAGDLRFENSGYVKPTETGFYRNINAQKLWSRLFVPDAYRGRREASVQWKKSEIEFKTSIRFGLNVNDITDTMSVKFTRIGVSDGSFEINGYSNSTYTSYFFNLLNPSERDMRPADSIAKEWGITILMGN
jgi:TolB-like protein